jgi:hypothetical protein
MDSSAPAGYGAKLNRKIEGYSVMTTGYFCKKKEP